MTLFKTDWIANDGGHVDEHNRSGLVLNDAMNLRMFDPHPNSNTPTARAANAAAFAAAILRAKRTDTVYQESIGITVPEGDYYLDQSIVIQNHWGLKLYSQGRGARILWRGGDASAIQLLDSRECSLSNLIISGEGLGIGVQLSRTSTGTVVPHHNTIDQCEIENFTDCASIGGAGALDSNNDFHEFSHCAFRDYHRYAVNLSEMCSQSYGNRLDGCIAAANAGTGQAAVYTGLAGGAFTWEGGGISANADADFIIGRHYQPSVIRGIVSEGSARLLRDTGSNYMHVTIEDCRWSGVALHTDRKAIKVDGTFVASLSVRNSRIGDGASPTNATLIEYSPTHDNGIGSFEFVNNWVFSSAQSVFSGRPPTSKSGCIQVLDEFEFSNPGSFSEL